MYAYMNYLNRLLVGVKDELRARPGTGKTKLEPGTLGVSGAVVASGSAYGEARIAKPTLEKLLWLLDRMNLLESLADYLESSLVYLWTTF